jgi:peptidoglycan/xylan/chitin deacetylase (PgdA/CDA1 family)
MLAKLAKAFVYWSGIAAEEARGARIVSLHGTPRRRAEELSRQLAYLKRSFRVVALGELMTRLESGARVDGMVALTFDDGLRNQVEVAYPLLERYELPATFFLCPQLIDEGAWLWTHEARLRYAWLEPEEQRRLARGLGAPVEPDPFLDWMKRLKHPPREAVQRTLRVLTPYFAAGWEDHEECDLAGWDELRRMSRALVSFGSHTLTHPMLRSLRLDRLQLELRDSRSLIEERLGRPAEFFAYPDGEHHAAAREFVRTYYRAAFVCARQSVEPGIDPYLTPRLALPRGALRLALMMNAKLERDNLTVGPGLTGSVRAA